MDLAVVSGTTPQLRLFFGDGAGTLTASPQAPIALPLANVVHLRALPAAAAPMGPADLVAASDRDLVGIPNQGAGTFGAPSAPLRTAGIRDIFPLDLNGDASMDLLFTQTAGSGVGIAIGGTRQR
jgi:hypothetical protein